MTKFHFLAETHTLNVLFCKFMIERLINFSRTMNIHPIAGKFSIVSTGKSLIELIYSVY